MKFPILLALLVVAASQSPEDEFEAWKVEHGRNYSTAEEETRRFEIWSSNRDYVQEHNAMADESGFIVELNKFADLELEEFTAIYNGFIPPPDNETRTMYEESGTELPTSVTDTCVTSVKDQGQCGSCWIFSAIGSLEGQQCRATGGSPVSLSEQNVLDCIGGNGCNGGWPTNVYNFIRNEGGVDTEAGYPPYQARVETCRFSTSTIGATVTGWMYVPQSASALQDAIATSGPMSVCIDASHRSFQLYEWGVYYEPACSDTNVDHCVTAVGYGVSPNGQEYWLVKNSWGSGWGMGGYIWMSRNRSPNCAITQYANFPTVPPGDTLPGQGQQIYPHSFAMVLIITLLMFLLY